MLIGYMLEDLLKDIIQEENVLISVNTGGAVVEMRAGDLPFHVTENWITIGDNDGPCHMHVNKNEVKEVRFVKEEKQTRTSYGIKLLNARGERLVGIFFTKMQDEHGNPIRERIERYESIFRKYGSREVITLQN